MTDEILTAINKYMKDTGYHQSLEVTDETDGRSLVELITEYPTTRHPLFSSHKVEDVRLFLNGIMTGFNLIGY